MATLLQTLLLETLPADTDPILRSYIETVLPAMEREFALIPALGGSEEAHYQLLSKLGDPHAKAKAQRWANRADQNLLVHVLNALLTAWNLTPYLSQPLSDVEKYLLCLGLTLHDYNKYCSGQGEETPQAYEVPTILELCQTLGEKLNFQSFWSDWQQYLPEIGYLAQNTQYKAGTNAIPANWPTFTIKDRRRLELPLRRLLAFGDIAVHLQDPAYIVTQTGGDRLREHLRFLGIKKKLVYHRLRDSLGILTNGIHNATVRFAHELEWEPILFFAQGVVYLAPLDTETPDCSELQEFIWQQISQLLGSKMLGGDIGFKRDGKGLKVAPQTLELFTPAQLIRQLPDVIQARVANVKDPATPKRLEKLPLSEEDKKSLTRDADIRADRLAEFVFLTQKEFFGNNPEYINWVLEALELQGKISPEQTQAQSGGVNYGWYHAAARYISEHRSLTPDEVSKKLSELAEKLAIWAEENDLLPEHHSPTREIFDSYLTEYLEVYGWKNQNLGFGDELATYTIAKTKAAKQPICSLSSGQFASEDQMDSVVLFKPQQYSNKNQLGGRQIKRGISKIWSLEMLLRQALWSASAGKFEEQQPVFLYIFPAYVYSPQTAAAIRLLVNDMKRVSIRKVCKQWLEAGMHYSGLRSLDWRKADEVEEGRYLNRYSSADLPFMATIPKIQRDKTLTDAWIEPAFLSLALPILLGVKVVATSSSVPLYNSDNDFRESVILDGPAGFWNLLSLPTSLRIQDLSNGLKRLLIAYSLHLDSRSTRQDERWRALIGTVREVTTNILNVFALANEGLRRDKRERPISEEVQRYWNYAQVWLGVNDENSTKETKTEGGIYLMKLIEELVQQYRRFYQVKVTESSHTILLPISKALEVILTVPQQVDYEDLILQGAGQLKDSLDRREVYNRPLLMDKSVDYATRQAQELTAIHTFMSTCVHELFGKLYNYDRALLQENRNRIKSGAEFAYRWLALQEKQSQSEQTESTQSNKKGEAA
jgi:CRISPR-associated protein Csc3